MDIKSYSPQQLAAIDKINMFIRSDDEVLILCGQAGSGKTSLIPRIAEISKTVVLSATNQGLQELKYKYGISKPKSIYREFYRHSSYENTSSETKELVEKFSRENTERVNTVFVIDNAELIPNITTDNADLLYGSGKILDDILKAIKIKANNNKVIFIGDDYQITPVSDNKSEALDKEYFEQNNLKVQQLELQGSLRIPYNIMDYADKLRNDILHSGEREPYEITDNRYDIFNLNHMKGTSLQRMEEIANKVAHSKDDCSIIITDSMRKAQEYNKSIRSKQNKSSVVTKGDILVLTKNIYYDDSTIIPSGTFIQIYSVDGSPEVHKLTVHGREIKLCFVKAKYKILNDPSGFIYENYLLTNILLNNKSALESNNLVLRLDYFCRSKNKIQEIQEENRNIEPDDEHMVHDRRRKLYWEQAAMNISKKYNIQLQSTDHTQIDDILKKNPECDPKWQCRRRDPYKELLNNIKSDKYFNSIVAKYGYATTVYRAIGSERENVYVDFENQNGYKETTLRWAYTAISRSKKRLIVVNKKGIFADRFTVAMKVANDSKLQRKIEQVHDNSSNNLFVKQLTSHLEAVCSFTGTEMIGITTNRIANNFINYYFKLSSGQAFELQVYFSHRGCTKANVYVKEEDQYSNGVKCFIERLKLLNPNED